MGLGRARRTGHVVACAYSSLLLTGCGCGGKREPQRPPPPVVSVAEAVEKDVPVYLERAGTLDAYVNADARARVEGVLLEQHYVEGSFVKAGQLLFVIDPKPFEAAKLQAQGNLEQAKAALAKAAADIARDRPLVAQQAVSQQDLDHDVAARDTANGQVASAEGALRTAVLNLGYTRVASPVDGIAGIAQVRIGNLVGQGSPTLLATVSQIDPIRMIWTFSERDYVSLAKRIRAFSLAVGDGGVVTDTDINNIELVLADGSVYPRSGRLAIISSKVDPTTGTLTAQALFPNPEQLLRPGQYGRVRIKEEVKHAVLIPQRAVVQTQAQNHVAVVGADDNVEIRTVKLGPVTGAFVIVDEGLKAGERIVIDGVDKAKSGQPVTVTPADTSALPLASAPVEVQTGTPAGSSLYQGGPPSMPSDGGVPLRAQPEGGTLRR